MKPKTPEERAKAALRYAIQARDKDRLGKVQSASTAKTVSDFTQLKLNEDKMRQKTSGTADGKQYRHGEPIGEDDGSTEVLEYEYAWEIETCNDSEADAAKSGAAGGGSLRPSPRASPPPSLAAWSVGTPATHDWRKDRKPKKSSIRGSATDITAVADGNEASFNDSCSDVGSLSARRSVRWKRKDGKASSVGTPVMGSLRIDTNERDALPAPPRDVTEVFQEGDGSDPPSRPASRS